MELVALSIAPGIAICVFIFYTDLYNTEPKKNLIISFLLGGLAILPAIGFEKSFTSVIDGSLGGVAIFAYCIVAFSEETCKFIGLRFYSYNQKAFDEPFDGIVYAVMVSMGFATVENIMYVVFDTKSVDVAYMRMFLSVLAHATFAVVMGYFMGKAKFNSKKSFALMITGLVGALLLHGTFDFFLFIKQYSFVGQEISDTLLFAGAIASFLIALALSRKLINRDRLISKQMFKDKNQDV